MRTIWKIVLNPVIGSAFCMAEMPMGSKVIMVKEQFENICVWYECDPANKKESRLFQIVGTGHECPKHGEYLGSASLQGGTFIFHVFEVPA